MSNLLVSIPSSSKKLFKLKQKLIVGFYIHGTIAHVSNERPCYIKPRPYLSYLMHTLQRLGCDVHLFTTLNPESDEASLRIFRHQHIGIPHFLHYEPAANYGTACTRGASACSRAGLSHLPSCRTNTDGLNNATSSGVLGRVRSSTAGNRFRGHSPNLSSISFKSLLDERAAFLAQTAGDGGYAACSPENVLFIDSEVNYRYSPLQTIVMESYVHYTTREKRQAYKEYVSGTLRQRGYEDEADKGKKGFAAKHQAEMERVTAATDFLLKEQEAVRERQGRGRQRLSSSLLCDEDKSDADGSTTSVVEDGAATQTSVGGVGTKKEEGDGAGKNGLSSSSTSLDRSGSLISASPSDIISYEKPIPSALLEDHTCVALATLVAELSASSLPVREFLKREVLLLEPVRVPNHAACYYLAKENCEDLETIRWDEVEVEEVKAEERRRADRGPEVPETAEHASFFK